MLKNIIFLCVLSFASANVYSNIGPDELVRKTADDVISTIKQDKDIQAGDTNKIYKLAEEKILPNFDFERISRLVLGKAWRKATDKQKTEFKYEFKNLLLRTYAVALSKYKDQKIEYKPLRMKPTDEIVTVKTEIIQSGGQPIDVDYALAKQDDGWLVIDIIIEGVSLVTNYRSQFASEIKKNGMDSLIIELAKKNKTNDS
ncbi:MAG: ABC transporter substrate-binding protein [Nitrosomonadales bacterium]|jgi:phospholipid transport system substrate-binding protein|nr:ABC transporter substrate-binding protein [Nitrosomonadales bacterium]MBT5411538.1 ABC transporter substrate-binding protein [Nitrosomonadales bacterium]MBT6141048.1 ABC transporter substrate-binding protein [Nitrosomonadales bacterium]MDC0877090.1 ABC transporter substrate-binding protein [Methylophilaceae bacterium]|tara:strand:- start:475 stop:1077 length:603 start_codon:yes stop_codon:yes gene_type:complete